MQECKHELPKSTCFDCKPKPKERVWPAKYEAICKYPGCLKVIDIGALVTWNAEGTHTIHASHGPQSL